jgi:arginine deiminase
MMQTFRVTSDLKQDVTIRFIEFARYVAITFDDLSMVEKAREEHENLYKEALRQDGP